MPCVLERWAGGWAEDAFVLIRKALEVDPVSVIWRLKQADLLLQVRKAADAGKIYQNVIVDAPDDARAYFGLAEVRSAQQRFDDAIALVGQGYRAAGLQDESILKRLSEARGAEGYRMVERIGAQLELEELADRAAANKYA